MIPEVYFPEIYSESGEFKQTFATSRKKFLKSGKDVKSIKKNEQ